MGYFDNAAINFDVLKKRAFNYRWAEVPDGVIPLTAADPDFPAHPAVREAIINYAKEGYFSYTPHRGMPDFMESISKALKLRKNEDVPPELILPIDSAARGMYVIAQTVLQPGDEMIVFDPVDFLFRQSCLSAGATPVLFPARLDGDHIDLSELERNITPKTKMIGLCNPHNPLGALYTREDLEHILSLAEKYDLYIMNDEIWSDIVYPPKKFISILELGAQRNRKTLSVFGWSKSFCVAGLRIGCVYGQDKELFDKVIDKSAVMTTAGGISSLSQIAGKTCVDQCYGWLDEFLLHLKGNRDYAVERINAMPGLRARKADATYLLFFDITQTGKDSQTFVDELLQQQKLALTPGSAKFFGPGAEGRVRLCYATSREVLKEGLDRLEAYTKSISK